MKTQQFKNYDLHVDHLTVIQFSLNYTVYQNRETHSAH